jgi:hypothetical protein
MSKRLPSITSDIPRDLRNFVDRLREMVASNGNDRLLNVTELKDAGVVGVNANGSLYAMATGGETVSFGPPPPPTGLAAAPAIRNVVVTWDVPSYPHHAYAEVWGASTDDIGTAELLGQTPGAVYVDALGPSATRYYWVRFVNTQFTTGAYNSTFGTSATTGPDLGYTMDILSETYGAGSEAPFFQLNSPQEIGGVTIPAGTYMKAAFIYDGVITNAKIADAAIDNAKIADLDAGKITTGFVSADRIEVGSLDAKLAAIDAAIIGTGFLDVARIEDASITTAKIGDAQITDAKIVSLDASKISVAQLSALSADMGTITAGTIRLPATGNSYIVIDGANSRIDVYEAGALRVRLGNLA